MKAACLSGCEAEAEWAPLQVVYPSKIDEAKMTFSLDAGIRRTGDKIDLNSANGSIELSIFVDHSVLEVFTEAGDALATRSVCAPPCLLGIFKIEHVQ